jgi:hypothetical protein
MSDRVDDDAGGPAASPGPARPDGTLQLSASAVAVLAVIISVIGTVVFGGRAGLGAGIGGAIAVANLVVFALVVRGVLAGGQRGRLWALVGILKIFLLFGGVWWVLKSGVTSAVALIFGYGALPLGIALGGLIGPRIPPEAPSDGQDSSGSASSDLKG